MFKSIVDHLPGIGGAWGSDMYEGDEGQVESQRAVFFLLIKFKHHNNRRMFPLFSFEAGLTNRLADCNQFNCINCDGKVTRYVEVHLPCWEFCTRTEIGGFSLF